jgi:2-amino-4-hydroxy-6-hydroxymethyldihydropteridine diphosphokinase
MMDDCRLGDCKSFRLETVSARVALQSQIVNHQSSIRMKSVYLSLGSNLGDRMGNLRKALELLGTAKVEVRRVSRFYKTEPVDFRPQAWFMNCVLEAGTDLMPLQLLRACQSLERALGRRPGTGKGPRLIDIDILLYEGTVVRSAALVIPHPRMADRRFVLIPLLEIAPHLQHPVTQQTIPQMLGALADASQVIRLKQE